MIAHNYIKLFLSALVIAGTISAQDAQTTQTVIPVTIFVQKAQAQGFSEQEIKNILDQVAQQNLQDDQLAQYLDQILEQHDNRVEEKRTPYGLYAVIACGSVLTLWVLYKLYKHVTKEPEHGNRIRMMVEPRGGENRGGAIQINPDELRASEEVLRRAIENRGNTREVVYNLARRHPGAAVRAEWDEGRTHHRTSIRCDEQGNPVDISIMTNTNRFN